MFFNASVQGLNAFYKLAKKSPKTIAIWSAGYFALGVMNALLHSMFDDDDDYMDMPEYERRKNIMLGGKGVYFKWALPQEAGMFYALGDFAVETIKGRNAHQTALETIGEAAKIATDILPISLMEGWRGLIPSVAVPLVELLANEDYKGSPIYNEMKWMSKEEKKHEAKWEYAYQNTGKVYIQASKLLNNVTDWMQNDLDNAGFINVSPEAIKHVVSSYLGGTYRTAENFWDTITNALDKDQPITVKQVPFINRILTLNDERYRNAYVNEVFDAYLGHVEFANNMVNKLRANDDEAGWKEFEKTDEYKWWDIYVTDYKDQFKDMEEDLKLARTSTERKELMKQQDQLKKDFLRATSYK